MMSVLSDRRTLGDDLVDVDLGGDGVAVDDALERRAAGLATGLARRLRSRGCATSQDDDAAGEDEDKQQHEPDEVQN